jgi:predicted nuclease of predicted toxin-antitoxin system
MRFCVDAQLPRRLAQALQAAGHEATHSLDLPAGNRTADAVLSDWADRHEAVMVTKDGDFLISRTLRGRPHRLLLLKVGNCRNDELLRLVEAQLARLVDVFGEPACVELSQSWMVVHP